MRDFLEYVEKNKEDSPNSLDFYMEGFSTDISKIEGISAEKTFILGFLAGKGISITENRDKIINLLSNKEITSLTESIASLKLEDMNVKDLRTSLNSALATLRIMLKEK